GRRGVSAPRDGRPARCAPRPPRGPEADLADVGGHVEPAEREPGHPRLHPRVAPAPGGPGPDPQAPPPADSACPPTRVGAAGHAWRWTTRSSNPASVRSILTLPRSGLTWVSLATCHRPVRRSRLMPEWISRGLASRRSGLVRATGEGSDRTTSASCASVLAAS